MKVKGLTFSYGDVRIFEKFDFESDSQIIAIEGPSGCGKTTLLKLLSGNLQPEAFDQMPRSDRSCLIVQEDSLFPWLTGTGNIVRVIGVPELEIKRHELYPTVEPFVAKRAHQMSYGQRRLVELFRAILYKPPVLYLDEPFNFLDSSSRAAVASILMASTRNGTSIMISTHHPDDLLFLPGERHKFDGGLPTRELRPV